MGRGAVEHQMLMVAKELDKPIAGGDFAKQAELLHGMREKLLKVKPTNLASFEFDPRTRLFTALLKLGRQTLPADAPEDKVKGRNQAFAELGALWKAFGEDERAGQAYAQAGDAKAAMTSFEKAGTWEGQAELHVKAGKFREAAKLFEEHGNPAEAAKLLEQGKDAQGALKLYLQLGNVDAAKEVLKNLQTDQGRKILTQLNAGDLLLDFLAGRGRWEDIGKLYEKAGMHADAAQAFIKGGRTHMAIRAFRAAGDEESAKKLIDEELEAAKQKGDAKALAETYARWKLFAQAAETILATDVEKAMDYVSKAGNDPEARKFAERQVQAAREAGDLRRVGQWHEKLGSVEEAARAYIEGKLPAEALRLFEQLGDWRSAGACAEQLGQKERAAEFYNRVGDYEAVERVRNSP